MQAPKYQSKLTNKPQGNVRFTHVKEDKHYVAYNTTYLVAGWIATPYTYSEADASYIPDASGAMKGKSRSDAVEKLFLKNFNMPEEGITHRRMTCIDHLN